VDEENYEHQGENKKRGSEEDNEGRKLKDSRRQ
jgi:hypothetical protein